MKWIIGVAAAGLLLLGGWRIGEWRQGYLERDTAIKARDAARFERDQAIAGLKAGLEKVNSQYTEYLNEVEKLRSLPLPTTPVRLCVPRRSSPPSTKSGADGRSSEPRMVDRRDGEDHTQGPDIRSDLNDYALRAAQYSIWVKSLQAYATFAAEHCGFVRSQ